MPPERKPTSNPALYPADTDEWYMSRAMRALRMLRAEGIDGPLTNEQVNDSLERLDKLEGR